MNNLWGVQRCWNVGLAAPATLGHVDMSGTGAHRTAAGAFQTPSLEPRSVSLGWFWCGQIRTWDICLRQKRPEQRVPRPEGQFFTMCPRPLYREFWSWFLTQENVSLEMVPRTGFGCPTTCRHTAMRWWWSRWRLEPDGQGLTLDPAARCMTLSKLPVFSVPHLKIRMKIIVPSSLGC